MKVEKLNELIELADKYDYKPCASHFHNLSVFVGDNASLISDLCKNHQALQQKLDASEALMLAMRDDSRESRSKLELITAECAALVNYIDGECYTESKRTGVYTCAGINKPASPATDAMVNEIRAEGVELLSDLAGKEYQRFANDKAMQKKWKGIVLLCCDFASKLRADAAKGGSDD